MLKLPYTHKCSGLPNPFEILRIKGGVWGLRGILDEDKTIQIRYCPYCGAKLVTTRYLRDLLRKRKELEKAIKSSKKYYSTKEIQNWMNAPLGKPKT